MTLTVLSTCLLIVLARIADVSLGTLRTVFVIGGRRYTSWVIGFIEVLIWVVVVSKVIHNLDNWVYAVCYAFGFATGTFIGMTVEEHLALGQQVVRIFSRRGDDVAEALREAGYQVTVFDGRGRDGPVQLLFIGTARRRVSKVADLARSIDPGCFHIVDDIRVAGPLHPSIHLPTGWRAVMKRK